MNRKEIYIAVVLAFSCLIILVSGITSVFAAAGDLKWKYEISGMALSQPSPAIGSDGTIYFVSGGNNLYAVDNDIKPDSYPNSINLKSNGVIPVLLF